ncbi:gremlin-1-like [Nematostella vectensis]|uniref:gremlin-1-like n=1 Tax=Nematostella vectensis TaxID=45351 RepID=UPI0020771857|nr:gremlin-1-like [Nematostella vectensis]
MNTVIVCAVVVVFCATAQSRPSKLEKEGLSGTNEEVFIMDNSLLKRGWCKTKPVKQIIRIEGCEPAEIVNNFCYGQCNSLYIPHYNRQTPAFESCATCIPVRVHRRSVYLNCPNAKQKRKRHRYTYVKRCRCVTFRLRAAGVAK